MARKVFRFQKGYCSCVIEHSSEKPRRAAVIKVSSRGAVLGPVHGLQLTECVNTTLILKDGPRIPLLARVTKVENNGAVLRWLHNTPADAVRLQNAVLEYVTKTLQVAPARRTKSGILKVDMGTAIRNKALAVNAADLAARHSTLHVLDMTTINDLIQEAVEEALGVLNQSFTPEDREEILAEAERLFGQRLQSFREQKRDLEAHTWKLQAQLDQAQAQLNEEKKTVVEAGSFVVSEAGMEKLDSQLSRLLERAVANGKLDGMLEEEMREALSRLLDDERAKILEREQEAQNDRIVLLERKIGRLAKSLEETEVDRDRAKRRAQALEDAGGLRNIMTAGLADDDEERERKLALLKEIFEQNKAMRQTLEDRGIMISGPASVESEERPGGENGPSGAAPSAGDSPGEEETGLGDDPELDPELMEPEAADNPDDLPWEPPSEAEAISSEEESSGVKRIAAKKVKPPPLARTGKAV